MQLILYKYKSLDLVNFLKLQLHDAIYCPDSFVMMLRYCANLKAIRYESTSLHRIVADKSHLVIVALPSVSANRNYFDIVNFLSKCVCYQKLLAPIIGLSLFF